MVWGVGGGGGVVGWCFFFFFFQAEDGIRDLVRSRGLGDVYKRQDDHIYAVKTYNDITVENQDKLSWLFGDATLSPFETLTASFIGPRASMVTPWSTNAVEITQNMGISGCLLYTSDAADERSSVDLGGRRIIKKKK